MGFFALNSHSKEEETRIYLPLASVDANKLIGPPPAIESPKFEEQMAIVLWLQKTRTPEQVEFVRKKLNLARFEPILGDSLFKVDSKELRNTLSVIISEVRSEYDLLKAAFDLPRPFIINKEVQPVTKARPVGSYPSGHATRSVVYARVLSEIFPEKKDELMNLALQIGYGRVTAGVHYPIDVTAGQALGNAYADVIISRDRFKETVSRIRGE